MQIIPLIAYWLRVNDCCHEVYNVLKPGTADVVVFFYLSWN